MQPNSLNEMTLQKVKYISTVYKICATILIVGLSSTAIAGTSDSILYKKARVTDEVVVTGTRNAVDVRYLPMDISVVTEQQISKRYEQSLLPILTEQVPGLFITSRGVMGYGVSTGAAGGMSIRGIGGSPTTEMLVLIDGHPQYMGLMGHPLADAYQSMLAEKVEVVRGPASVLYGSNAMGGVINIVTHKLYEDGIKNQVRLSEGSFNTLTSEVSNCIRKGRFSSVFNVSYVHTDGHRDNMDYKQYGGYAKLGYEINNIWNIFADMNLTHFKASNPGTISAPIIDNDSYVTRGMASVSLENKYNRTSGALNFFYNWGNHKINDGYSQGESPLDYRFHSTDQLLGISWYQTTAFFTGNRVTFGVDYQHMGGEAWNQYTNSRTELADKSQNEIAGYMDFRQDLGELFTFDAGLRLDYHSQVGATWIPQAGLSMHLPFTAELKALVSKGFRNPTIRELYMFASANPNLLPEEMMNYEVSWSQHLLNRTLSYGLNVFYIDGKNMIQTVAVSGRPMNINTGRVNNWGVESTVSYRLNPMWILSANYSWLKMKYPVLAAPQHKLYVGGDYTDGKWSVSTGVQYIAGLYTSINPLTTSHFFLWNLRGSCQIARFAQLFVRGENLLAQRYEINAGFPMPRATAFGGINLNF